jgi:glycerol-3-phosphate dehydrogenase
VLIDEHSNSTDGSNINSNNSNAQTMTNLPKSNPKSLRTRFVVNAAGAWAKDVVSMAVGLKSAGESFIVRPKKRCVFLFHCPDASVTDSPLGKYLS